MSHVTINHPPLTNSLPPHHLTFKPFHRTISLKTVRPASSALRHGSTLEASPRIAGHRRSISTSMRKSMPTEQPRSFEQRYTEKTSRSGSGSSQRRTRRAVHQLSLRAPTTSVQSFQGALCCSKAAAVPNWQPWQPAPWLFRHWTPSARGLIVGLALRPPRRRRAATQTSAPEALQQWRPPNRNTGWNSRDFSAAFGELWTRFVTRAGSCWLALRQLFLHGYRTRH